MHRAIGRGSPRAAERGTGTHAQPSFGAVSHDNDSCDDHICDWVVTGGYKASERHDLPQNLVYSFSPLLIDILPKEEPLPLDKIPFAEWSKPPPGQAEIVLFVCRTAQPARGPSLFS